MKFIMCPSISVYKLFERPSTAALQSGLARYARHGCRCALRPVVSSAQRYALHVMTVQILINICQCCFRYSREIESAFQFPAKNSTSTNCRTSLDSAFRRAARAENRSELETARPFPRFRAAVYAHGRHGSGGDAPAACQLHGAAVVDHGRSTGGDRLPQQLSLVVAAAMIHTAVGEIANTRSRGLSVTGDER